MFKIISRAECSLKSDALKSFKEAKKIAILIKFYDFFNFISVIVLGHQKLDSYDSQPASLLVAEISDTTVGLRPGKLHSGKRHYTLVRCIPQQPSRTAA
jgi:hypothetical protein